MTRLSFDEEALANELRDGLPLHAIAQRLHLTEAEAKRRTRLLYDKLGVQDRKSLRTKFPLTFEDDGPG